MKTFIQLEGNRVVGISEYNVKNQPTGLDGFVDVTSLDLPSDLKDNLNKYCFDNGVLRELTETEVSANDFSDEDYLNSIRLERTKRLAECDWTQVPDAPVDKEAWATYRQALRDFTNTVEDVRNPVWPAKPE